MKRLHLLSIIAASIAASACVTTGGGMTPDKLTRPIRADDKPYIGEKPFGMDKIKFSKLHDFHTKQPEAWTLGNFFGDGSKAVFSAHNVMALWKNHFLPAKEIMNDPQYLSVFEISNVDDAGNLSVKITLQGCLYARTAAAADFNKSGRDGVVVACAGYDNPEVAGHYYPGEKMKLVLPDGKGGFTVSDVGGVGFNHSVDAADVNGDGYPDIVVGDPNHNPPVYFLMNQKDGTFKKDTSRISGLTSNTGYYTTKLIDIDGDGIVDLSVGGMEDAYKAQAAVLFGDKDGTFGKEKLVIPKVQDKGLVYDFIPITSNGERVLYVNRTGDQSTKCQMEKCLTLQSVNLTTGIVKIEYDRIGKLLWVPWWFPVKQDGKVGVTTYFRDDNGGERIPPVCGPNIECY